MEEMRSSVLHHICISKKDEMHIMANSPFEAGHSRGTVRPMLERMGRTLTEKKNKKQKQKQRAHIGG